MPNLESLDLNHLNTVEGDLVLERLGPGVTSLPLAGLYLVAADFVLRDLALQQLGSLPELLDIDGVLRLINPGPLTSLTHLPLLVSVGGIELVATQLTSFAGFETLDRIHRGVWLVDNCALSDFTGLEGVNHLGQELVVTGNPALDAQAIDAFISSSGFAGVAEIDLNPAASCE